MLTELLIITILCGVAFPRPEPFGTLYRVWSALLILLWLAQALGLATFLR